MVGRRLLDTNIVVALFNGDRDVMDRMAEAPDFYVSVVVLGELHFGASHSDRPEANATRIDEFVSTCPVLGVDDETARHYGQIKGELRQKGRPIPDNDLWIAACARQYGLSIVTRDRHFSEVEDLVTEAW